MPLSIRAYTLNVNIELTGCRSKPQSRAYELLIPYPRAVLSNPDQTIAEADLNNACIAQKFT